MRFCKHIVILMAALVLPLCASAQKPKKAAKPAEKKETQDSLVRLVSADSLLLMQINGVSYRKVVGKPARFLHNNTYLICDTALWNVDEGIINAMGKVKIIQDRTELKSDRLNYYVDKDLAEFRGTLVQLSDKDKNTLRTHYLDYNTKDSVAVFRNGAAMRDKDGQLIESLAGTYDSKIQTFTFTEDVNMYTDSVFLKTTYLKYESNLSLATFGFNTNAWRDDKMLSANAGTYDRSRELFFFRNSVHVMSDTQEGWSDSLYVNRATMDVKMLGNAQVMDTTRNVSALAGCLYYVDSLATLELTRNPAIVSEIDDKQNGRDSVWFGADTIRYWSVKKCEVDSLESVMSDARLKSVDTDPVASLRKQAAEAAAKAAEEAAANDPNNAANAAKKQAEYAKTHGGGANGAPSGSTKKEIVKPARVTDLASKMPGAQTKVEEPEEPEPPEEESGDEPEEEPEENPEEDSGDEPTEEPNEETGDEPTEEPEEIVTPEPPAAPEEKASPVAPAAPVEEPEEETPTVAPEETPAQKDSVVVEAEPLDTTKIGFLMAKGKVKVYRETMQVLCDSLRYTDLDSLARLYKEPKIWNETTHQYIADSIYVLIKNGAMDKANLMSNSFIHIQEDSTHFDQIRATEMTAFFDADAQLSRFDALGGAQALFYIQENDALATVNKKDSKMLSALFKDGSIQKIYYFQDPKSDAYPVVQMSKEDQTIKGFAWAPQDRPKSRFDVSTLSLRKSQRTRYENVPRGKFLQTELYFPGYMKELHRQLELADSLKAVRARERRLAKAREEARRDSLARVDSLVVPSDSLAVPSDSALASPTDSLAAGLDSLVSVADSLGMTVDTLVTSLDSLASVRDSVVAHVPTPEELKAQADAEKAAAKAAAKAEAQAQKEAKRKEREEKKAAKLAAQEERWAEKDTRDALKQAAKDARKAAKLRKKKAKALEAKARQEAKEQAAIEKYIYKYEKKKGKTK